MASVETANEDGFHHKRWGEKREKGLLTIRCSRKLFRANVRLVRLLCHIHIMAIAMCNNQCHEWEAPRWVQGEYSVSCTDAVGTRSTTAGRRGSDSGGRMREEEEHLDFTRHRQQPHSVWEPCLSSLYPRQASRTAEEAVVEAVVCVVWRTKKSELGREKLHTY
ncbi:hypothetical protein BDV95DRAFT_585080 [Massariosphaeria phaeospora]|uniref:Uncharacterized protein n=1 Tax=Massariosphaeria phaeospora TaxID=100035 RepID=A0A7C8I297_9PLEO|nr:hypothetical protein BDV95DRAFT_585080 [Massariosphaeria phaeospora]